MLVCSSGGHLSHLNRLAPWWKRHERLWLTFRKADSLSLLEGERVMWAFHPTTRNLVNLLRNLRLAWRVVADFEPDVVISTGAGVAFLVFLVARARCIPSVYLEVYDRIDSATLTGRLCYPLSSLLLLQRKEQRRWYPRGVVIGTVF
jgi:UDP-N-acetylglucosamine:LPS N-acetylglucosamine transferase